MTLLNVIQALEGIARRQPAVAMVVPNDVFRLSAIPDARYGVFAWTQGQHRERLAQGLLNVSLTLFYVDRLTADRHNELEIQSVGIQVLGNILRGAEAAGIYVADTVRYTTFNQRFEDECAGVFCAVDLEVPVDWLCPEEFGGLGDFNDDFSDDFYTHD